jgi:hypothetical protein
VIDLGSINSRCSRLALHPSMNGLLLSVSPESILTPGKCDALEEFFLALALVFNDLKTVVLLKETLPRRPGKVQISRHVGQRGGIGSHLTRLAAGIIHELLNLIDASSKVLNDGRFIDILGKVDPKCSKMWWTLVDHAVSTTPASKVLCMIRNNAAFHYKQPTALAKGFRAWYFDDAKIPQNETAYVSTGQDMDATRFYFADAAAQRSLSVLAGKNGITDVDETVKGFVQDTNFALAALVRQYLYGRDPASGVEPLGKGAR